MFGYIHDAHVDPVDLGSKNPSVRCDVCSNELVELFRARPPRGNVRRNNNAAQAAPMAIPARSMGAHGDG